MAIQGFADTMTEAVSRGRCPKGFPANLFETARRKLALLDAARSLDDLRSPPGNKLHALEHDRLGQHAIRINDQFRVCFVWTDAGPEQVEIADYHEERAVTDAPEIVAALPPLHPGEVLCEEYLVPLGLSAGAVATACGVPRTRIERIAREEIGITADTALRLGRLFRTTPDLWINLQKRFELETARSALGAEIERIEPSPRVA